MFLNYCIISVMSVENHELTCSLAEVWDAVEHLAGQLVLENQNWRVFYEILMSYSWRYAVCVMYMYLLCKLYIVADSHSVQYSN